jgi:hypothetical protein
MSGLTREGVAGEGPDSIRGDWRPSLCIQPGGWLRGRRGEDALAAEQGYRTAWRRSRKAMTRASTAAHAGGQKNR